MYKENNKKIKKTHKLLMLSSLDYWIFFIHVFVFKRFWLFSILEILKIKENFYIFGLKKKTNIFFLGRFEKNSRVNINTYAKYVFIFFFYRFQYLKNTKIIVFWSKTLNLFLAAKPIESVEGVQKLNCR